MFKLIDAINNIHRKNNKLVGFSNFGDFLVWRFFILAFFEFGVFWDWRFLRLAIFEYGVFWVWRFLSMAKVELYLMEAKQNS